MANLDQLEQEVADLVRNESADFEFKDVYRHIEDAAETATNAEIDRLRDILSSFRGKLPNMITLKPTRVRAKDLAATLMLSTLEDRIGRIRARNDVLTDLTGELKTQITKANNDAGLLKRIKEAVEKANKTVDAVKDLVDQLTDTDANTRSRIKALIDSLSEISSIFTPQEA